MTMQLLKAGRKIERRAKKPTVSALASIMGGTGKMAASHVLDFIERGPRAQTAVDPDEPT